MRAFRRPRRTCRGAWANTECGTGGLIVDSLGDLIGLRLSDPEEPVTSETHSLAAMVLWYCWSSTKHEDRLEKLKSAAAEIDVESDDMIMSIQAAKENVQRCLGRYRAWHPDE